MNENDSYAAIEEAPWSILEWWGGKWVFAGCFETEQEARSLFGRLNTQQLLRHGTKVIARQEFVTREEK